MRRLAALLRTLTSPAVVYHALGMMSIGLIVLGVWGLLGWQWAAISAGLPIAAFYLWTEARVARGARPGGAEQ